MSIFRVILCAAGIIVFLLVRYYATSADRGAKSLGQPATTTNSQPSAAQPVITHLELRDKKVTIKSTPSGPVYEVRTKAGRLVARTLSEKELLVYDPHLHKLIHTAIGSAPPSDGHFTDARLDARVTLAPAAK